MAVQTFTILQKQNHAPGPYTFPVTAMPANMRSARISIDSTQGGVLQYTDPATHIAVTWFTSTDGGQSYVGDGMNTDGGGMSRNVPTDPSVDINFPTPPDHAQGTIVVSGGTVRFGVFADVTF